MNHATINRYSTSITVSVLVTAALLFAMQAMIATGVDPVAERIVRVLPNILVERKATEIEKRRKPELPPEPAIQPPQATLTHTDPGTGIRVQHLTPGDPHGPLELPAGASQSGMPVPLVKVAAVYPQRAIGRGLEGFVIVEFTVTAAGTVIDVRVVDASDSVFVANAIAAAEKFRYRPRFVDGQAVATHGVLNKFTFELEN